MNWVVYCEFEDREVAEKFFEALGNWLSEMTSLPPSEEGLRALAGEEFHSPEYGPRHWLYDDASPCLGPADDPI